MRLYYTGALAPNSTQVVAEASIGGYPSSTPVPNDYMNNLLSDISQLTLQAKGKDTRAIVLKNTMTQDALNVTLQLVYPQDPQIVLEIAAVALGVDNCNVPIMEAIPNLRSTPLTGHFYRPLSAFALARLVVEITPVAYETIAVTIGGEQIGATPPFVGTPTLLETAIAVAAAINEVGIYEAAAKYDELLAYYYVEIKALSLGPCLLPILVINAGSAYLSVVPFTGDLDRSLNIGNLEAGKAIGLWIRKTLRPELGRKLTPTELENQSTNYDRALQLFISWT